MFLWWCLFAFGVMAAAAEWARRRAPIILVFSGAYGSLADYACLAPWARAIFSPFACVVTLVVGEVVAGQQWWAEYTPTDAEIQWQRQHGHSEEEAFRRAAGYTYNADPGRLPEAMRAARDAICGCVAARARPLFVIGFSNGCIPAVEAAHLFSATALWLASGVPSASQQKQLHTLPCPIFCSASVWERYWGGAQGVLRATRSAPLRTECTFQGRHGYDALDSLTLSCASSVFRRAVGVARPGPLEARFTRSARTLCGIAYSFAVLSGSEVREVRGSRLLAARVPPRRWRRAAWSTGGAM